MIPQPAVYHTAALPIVLHQQTMEPTVALAATTLYLRNRVSTIELRGQMVRVVGNDPTTLRLRAESSAN